MKLSKVIQLFKNEGFLSGLTENNLRKIVQENNSCTPSELEGHEVKWAACAAFEKFYSDAHFEQVRNVLPVTIALYAFSLLGDVSGVTSFPQAFASPGVSDAITVAATKNETKATEGTGIKAATDQIIFQTVHKDVSMSALGKYGSIDISVQDPTTDGNDKKEIKYTGVPLKTILSEMVPDIKLESMPEIKTAAKRELVVEVKGADGYPALIPVADIILNRLGDRFLLATHKDGKLIESGPQLICKMDQAKTRWVREVVSLRVVGLRD